MEDGIRYSGIVYEQILNTSARLVDQGCEQSVKGTKIRNEVMLEEKKRKRYDAGC